MHRVGLGRLHRIGQIHLEMTRRSWIPGDRWMEVHILLTQLTVCAPATVCANANNNAPVEYHSTRRHSVNGHREWPSVTVNLRANLQAFPGEGRGLRYCRGMMSVGSA